MRALIILVVGLLAVGCGKSEAEKLEAENKKLEAELKEEKHKLDAAEKNKKLKEDLLKLSVVGSYAAKVEERTFKHVFLENGKVVHLNNGEKVDEGTWKIVGEEVIVESASEEFKGFGSVYKIEVNGDLTWIAAIMDGKRKDFQKKQTTYKKIK